MKDACLMMRARHFLGMMESNFSRFVFELIAVLNSKDQKPGRVVSVGDWVLNP